MVLSSTQFNWYITVQFVISQVVELDLSTVVSSCSGPKRPHDRVAVTDMKPDFEQCLRSKIGFKGYAIKQDKLDIEVPMEYEGDQFSLSHGKLLWWTQWFSLLFIRLAHQLVE